MIHFIKGQLDTVSEQKIVVENQGMGYEILVPASVLSKLPAIGMDVKIYIYMHSCNLDSFQKLLKSFQNRMLW